MTDFEFSSSIDDVTRNLLKLHSYALGTQQERHFHFNRIYNAEHQVYYRSSEGAIFAPVKWCGARDNSIARYEQRKRKISTAYQNELRKIGFLTVTAGQPTHDQIYKDFIDFCYSFGFKNSEAGVPHSNSRPRTFWTTGFVFEAELQNFSDEIGDPQAYYEGASKVVSVNAYERNSHARLACIAHYGWQCQVCDLNFLERYGHRGKEFIHVHHIRALHEIGEEYEVDPIEDLRPVCPNCHAMIHRRKPYLTVEELSKIVNKQSS